MAAHDIGYLIELAGAGITPDCCESGPELAGFLHLLPELADALADSLAELAGYMDDSGLSGAAGEHIAEAGVAARAMHEAAEAVSVIFMQENRFWLAGAAEYPATAVSELAERTAAGFIPVASDHLIEFLQRLPELAGVIAAGLCGISEKAGETRLGETVSDMIGDVAVQAGMIRECADSAWGAFEDAHAFWLATR